MQNAAKASYDSDSLLMENREQSLTDDVAEALADRRAKHLALLALTHEPDYTPEMRQESLEMRKRMLRTMINPPHDIDEVTNDLRDAAFRRADQISTILEARAARRLQISVSDLTKWSDHIPAPVDHSFWWAQTQPFVAPATRAEFREDGLHFFGGPKVNDYDGEMHTSFGAVASFALQPERFPTSPSGKFLSSPHVELFGGIEAYAPNWDLIQGNGIAECKLFLRQTIFQLTFAEGGPGVVTVAEAKGYDAWSMYLRNTGYSRRQDMPGFKPIQPVTYHQSQLFPGTLFADIEVRLDIYLNCTGAQVSCNPNVLLRTFQWAPTPLP